MQLKYQIQDYLQIKDVITSLGYKSVEKSEHTDTYYLSNAEQNGFRNVSLRYRLENVTFGDDVGERHYILHEDNGRDGQQVGQHEIMVSSHKAAQLAESYKKLFGVSGVIEKNCEVFIPVDDEKREVKVEVHRVKNLGGFLEIEVPENADALIFMKSVAAQFGLSDDALVEKNYPDMHPAMQKKPKMV